MIKKVITSSRTTEVSSVAMQIIDASQLKDWSADGHLSNLWGLLENKSNLLNGAIRQAKVISDLDELDGVSEDKIRALYYILLGYTHNPDEVIKKAANVLMDIFNRYGLGMFKESYAVQTSLTESLLGDFSADDIKVHLDALPGVKEAIAQVNEAHLAFKGAQLNYKSDVAKEDNQQNASEIKRDVIAIINNKLVVYLRAMVQVDEAQYAPMAQTIAKIISDNNENVKRRKAEPAQA
jgi:hypothetical protein